MRYRFGIGLALGLAFAAGVAYSAGTVAFFTAAPSSSGLCVTTAATDGSLTAAACTGGGNVSTNATNAYVSPSINTYASGVEIVGPSSSKTTAYTTTAADCGSTIFGNSSTAFTITLLTTAVPVGCTIAIVQQGTAKVSVGPGANIGSVNSFTGTKAQWAVISVTADTATHWVLSGDGA